MADSNSSTPQKSSAQPSPSTPTEPMSPVVAQVPERNPFLILSTPLLNFSDAIQAQPNLQFSYDDINQDVIVQHGNSTDFVSKLGQKFSFEYVF